MTFELVRIGWPNTAAILALAIMPIVALTTVSDRRPAPVAVEQAEPAAFCQPQAGCTLIAAVATVDAVIE